MAAMYAVYHGPKGLRHIASRIHLATVILAQGKHQWERESGVGGNGMGYFIQNNDVGFPKWVIAQNKLYWWQKVSDAMFITLLVVIFANFASQTSRKFPLQFMSIYSNENIRKIAKLSSWISAPIPKPRKYLYAKIMAYTQPAESTN